MKIDFVYDSYGGVHGGAERFSHELVQYLKSRGHSLHIHTLGNADHVEVRDGVTVSTYAKPKRKGFLKDSQLYTLELNRIFAQKFSFYLEQSESSLVIAAGMLCIGAIEVAKNQAVTSMLYIHGLEAFSPDFFVNRVKYERASFFNVAFRFKLKWPIVKKYLAAYRHCYRQADHLVANSSFVSNLVESLEIRNDVQYFYPLFATSNEPTLMAKESKSADGAILFYKPQAIKGAALFCEVARAMPYRNFIVLGRLPTLFRWRIRSLKNIQHVRCADDMNVIWNKVSVVIGPTCFPEPFGRVFIEAGLRSIPSICTNLGGLSESAGTGGLYLPPFARVDKWVEKITSLEETTAYASYSLQAFNYASELLLSNAQVMESLFTGIFV